MGRWYKLMLEVRGQQIDIEDIQKIFNHYWTDGDKGSKWAEDGEEVVVFSDEGYLSGGEEETHEEIKKAVRKIYPDAKVITRWTYLEELPYNEYN